MVTSRLVVPPLLLLLFPRLFLLTSATSDVAEIDDRVATPIAPLLTVTSVSGPPPDDDVTEALNHQLEFGFTSRRARCQAEADCHRLPVECLSCNYDYDCLYGHSLNITCQVHSDVICQGPRTFDRPMTCRYCYQTSASTGEHTCPSFGRCTPHQSHVVNCTAAADVLCLGQRSFSKKVRCNWTSGYRWSTTLALSVTLGGFGADRFYLGHWQEGIGKLFSFGGLGVWTVVDVVLVAVGYLRPADGSLYI